VEAAGLPNAEEEVRVEGEPKAEGGVASEDGAPKAEDAEEPKADVDGGAPKAEVDEAGLEG
jgi:hypothetical protein